jgi:hypothetical protein
MKASEYREAWIQYQHEDPGSPYDDPEAVAEDIDWTSDPEHVCDRCGQQEFDPEELRRDISGGDLCPECWIAMRDPDEIGADADA